MKLKKSGFLPQNKTKFARLFFAIKSFFVLFVLLYSINSLIKFIPLKDSMMLLIGCVLFLLLFATKILQGVCIYQNVYEDLYEHRYQKLQKFFIYIAYTISLAILPISFVFLILQYNSLIKIEKLNILNKPIAILFISLIVLFCIIEGLYSSLAPRLIEKIKFVKYGVEEDWKIKMISNDEIRQKARQNKNKRDDAIKKIDDEIKKIDQDDRHLKNSKYVELIEQKAMMKNSEGYYYLNIGTNIKNEKKYKIVEILGIITNLLDLSLLSINSIDFKKNNGIEFEEITEKNEKPTINLNSICYIKYQYVEDDKK